MALGPDGAARTAGPGRSAGNHRVGVFGGTFDPVHVGHLAVAVNVGHALGLDRVLLVVAREPWQKVGTRPIAPGEDRFALVEAALEGLEDRRLEASRLELDRPGPSYMADTLAELSRRHPGVELFLIVGPEVADDLATWERPDEVCRLATLVVVTRPGVALLQPPPPPWRSMVVEVPALHVSSTELRARAAAGRPLDVLVPPGAVQEIRRRGLYAGCRDDRRWDDAGDGAG
ncbi:MAG: nicotinate-nucleotide adenylyltransferase [Actinomycetota bacterium]|nr:nicotinate-nucleotide adenylyltransferase [Actinomycetota bacterium]